MSRDLLEELSERAAPVSKASNADILVYAGKLSREHDDEVIDLVLQRRRRENVVFFVTTYGGDPDAAYRIARTLRRAYKRVIAVVAGFCKSAGTLLVLGADELVMFDHAELGPLDVQLWKEDSLGERSSGLTPTQAFLSLDAQVHQALQSTFLMLRLDLRLSTKTAGELATRTVAGLYGGIYAQFDPLRLGEIQRAQAVALHYGRRLVEQRHRDPRSDSATRVGLSLA
ncbi:SDH family Clp fold serine proteinase [Pendulispora albinea]|uniref:ATP-dependent Clp protease proteolytic subunit n=1 Tax=Pendulispora albinea TaxID=2741071 RepID=A0ABZ2LPD7_9BACT